MRVFKNKRFSRFTDKEGIADGDLWEMVNRLETGQADMKYKSDIFEAIHEDAIAM